jgi:glycosyltransferase involved in cell wall biosynthesis
VVATACGGPADIVSDEVGALVPPEDPDALANGIERVLARLRSYEPIRLRAYAIERFGSRRVGARIVELYREALQRCGRPELPAPARAVK